MHYVCRLLYKQQNGTTFFASVHFFFTDNKSILQHFPFDFLPSFRDFYPQGCNKWTPLIKTVHVLGIFFSFLWSDWFDKVLYILDQFLHFYVLNTPNC